MPGKPRGTESTGKSNRIRLVVLDAELSDTNVTDLAQAITLALRSTSAAPALPAPRNGQQALASGNGPRVDGKRHEGESADEDTEVVEQEADAEDSSRPRTEPERAARKTAPRAPKSVPDLFTKDSLAEFQKYATEHPTDQHAVRYLIAAMWLKDHGQPTINVDKVYSCYKAAGWPLDIADWGVAFRNHANRSRKMKSEGKGEYSILPLGEQDVDNLKA